MRGSTSAARSACSLCCAASSEHCVVNAMRTTMHAAVTMALRNGPDNLPANIKSYVAGGCKCIGDMIEASARDYDWTVTEVTFPGHE